MWFCRFWVRIVSGQDAHKNWFGQAKRSCIPSYILALAGLPRWQRLNACAPVCSQVNIITFRVCLGSSRGSLEKVEKGDTIGGICYFGILLVEFEEVLSWRGSKNICTKKKKGKSSKITSIGEINTISSQPANGWACLPSFFSSMLQLNLSCTRSLVFFL